MAYKRRSPMPIVEGGTNATSMANTNGVAYYSGSSIVTTTVGNATEVLTSNGAGLAPTFQSLPAAIDTIDGDTGVSATDSTVVFTGVPAGGTVRFNGDNSGQISLQSTDSDFNTIYGLDTVVPTTGQSNNFFGSNSGSVGTGNCEANNIFGLSSLISLDTGSFNTSIGDGTLANLTSGSYNIAVGAGSGNFATGSSNIWLNHTSGVAESNTLRIGDGTGTGDQQLDTAYIYGINGVDLSTTEVVTMAADRLGSAALTVAAQNGTPTFTAGSGTIELVWDDGANDNVGIGSGGVLNMLNNGQNNTAFGSLACNHVTDGNANTGLGFEANYSVDTGSYNVAVGMQPSLWITSGSRNTVVGGNQSAVNYTSTESDNIILGNNPGVALENNVLRIGAGTGTGNWQLNAAYVAGIQGITVTGTSVLISANDQLGIAVSSERFKQDIQDMGTDSSFIYNLRPVTFKWNKDSAPGLKDATDERQFGLIAEEVEQVMPSLVAKDKNGTIVTVKYQDLPAILLNEIQHLKARIDELERKLSV